MKEGGGKTEGSDSALSNKDGKLAIWELVTQARPRGDGRTSALLRTGRHRSKGVQDAKLRVVQQAKDLVRQSLDS